MSGYRCLSCMELYDNSLSVCPNCGHRKNSPKTEPYYLDEGIILDQRYTVGKVQSEDKYGITYIAWDEIDSRRVVLKEYFPREYASRNASQKEVLPYDGKKGTLFEKGLNDFLENSTKLISLSDALDGIVRVLGNFIENSTAYYVMEYLDGISLDVVLKNGSMNWQDVVTILTPVINSLRYIHGANLAITNIAPQNIIMTRSREVKIRGLEAACAIGSSTEGASDSIISGFSPYELYQSDENISPASDVYSIAAVVYNCITGEIPPSAVDRYNKDTLVPPSRMGVKLPKNIENAVLNALNISVEYRTPNCEVLLNQFNTDTEIKRIVEPKRKVETGKMSGKVKALIIAAIIVAAGIIGSIAFFMVGNINVIQTTETDKNDIITTYKGKFSDRIRKEITKHGIPDNRIEIKPVYKVKDDKIPEDGEIINQNFKGLSFWEIKGRLNENPKNKIVFSVFTYVSFPDFKELKGKTPEEAEKIIENSKNGKPRFDVTSSDPKGETIIKYDDNNAGKTVKKVVSVEYEYKTKKTGRIKGTINKTGNKKLPVSSEIFVYFKQYNYKPKPTEPPTKPATTPPQNNQSSANSNPGSGDGSSDSGQNDESY